MFQFM